VPYGDAEATAEAIREAFNSGKGKLARERIRQLFPMERREKDLLQLVDCLVPQER